MPFGTCDTCRRMRAPAKVDLFSPNDLLNSEVLKVHHEVHEWQRQRQLDEVQRAAARYVFEHQPQNFPWCEGFSREINKYFRKEDALKLREHLLANKRKEARELFHEIVATGQELRQAANAGDGEAAAKLEAVRRDRTHPVTGQVISFFVLAEYMNGDGGCDMWEPLPGADT
jgi:hypothetical protein